MKREATSGTPEEVPPEVQAMLAEHVRKHWRSWLDQPVLALNHLTPREAAKTDADRERLAALLLDFERKNHRQPDALKIDVDWLKNQLGLK